MLLCNHSHDNICCTVIRGIKHGSRRGLGICGICAVQHKTEIWYSAQPGGGGDMILAVNVPQNHWFVHICLCHELQTILTFLVNVSYHVHITWLPPDFLIGKRRVWWWSYRPEACQVTKVQECVSTFIKIDIHDIFKETVAQFPLVFCGNVKLQHIHSAEMHIANIYSDNWL